MFEQTGFDDLIIFSPNVYHDERGNFHESYNEQTWQQQGINIKFIQDNQSESSKGVLRGLHYQEGAHGQTKLVRAIFGCVQVAVVDLRKHLPTYGKYFSIILDDINKKQLLVPKGFAHGFLTLSDRSIYGYKVDEYRYAESERGINAFDPTLNIDWNLNQNEIIRKEADQKWPPFALLV